jgi:hypothetical protein
LDGFTKNLDLFILRTFSSLGKNIDMTLQQKKCDDYNINEYIDFLCSIPLNQYTKDLQLELFTLLKTIIPNLDDKIKYKKARQLYYLFSNHKQRNTITKLIETKNKIHQKNIPIV